MSVFWVSGECDESPPLNLRLSPDDCTLFTLLAWSCTHTNTHLSLLQKPRSLPCSAEQDKSHLGRTSVSLEEGRKRGGGKKLSSSPPFHLPLLLSSVWMDRRQWKQRIKQETGGKVIHNVCECVCVCTRVRIQSCSSISFSPHAITYSPNGTLSRNTTSPDPHLWPLTHTKLGSLSHTNQTHTHTRMSPCCKQLKQSRSVWR